VLERRTDDIPRLEKELEEMVREKTKLKSELDEKIYEIESPKKSRGERRSTEDGEDLDPSAREELETKIEFLNLEKDKISEEVISKEVEIKTL